MPRNIDEDAQRIRKKNAYQSAWIASGIMSFTGFVLLALRFGYHITGFWGMILVIIAVLNLGMIVPVWILLKERLKEIEGGEEDAATQY